MSQEPLTRQNLREAVIELKNSVNALETTLENDYPTKAEINKRRRQIAFSTIVAVVASYFLAVGTINYCFLGDPPSAHSHTFCNIFPGYNESVENNRELEERFVDVEKFVQENRDLIEGLRRKDTDAS